MLWKTLSTAALTLGLSLSFAGGEVALTIDDMPFLGSAGKNEGKLRREAKRFRMVLDILKEEKVPAAGFVVAGTIEPGQWTLLEEWHNSGNIIANHTYSHPRLSSSDTQKYIDNVTKADKVLTPLMQGPKYFRYPFLSTGRNAEQKQAVRDYLAQQNYIIAPVTIDSKDFRFNARLMNIHWRKRKAYLPGIRRQYIGYIWSQTKRAEKKSREKNGPTNKAYLAYSYEPIKRS